MLLSPEEEATGWTKSLGLGVAWYYPTGRSGHTCPGHRAFSALSPRKLHPRTTGAVGVKAAPQPLLPSPAQPWTTQLWDLTGFSCEDLIPCVLSLHQKW